MLINKLKIDNTKYISISLHKGLCCIECGYDPRDAVPLVKSIIHLRHEELKSLHNVIETAMFMMEGRK